MATSNRRGGEHVHTVPANTHAIHVTRSGVTDCWCEPAHYRICPECDGLPAGCWRCQDGVGVNGMVRITPAEARVIGEALVVVHNDRPVPLP